MNKISRRKKPLTVLHTEWSSGWGGQEIRILAESQALRARGYNMMIATQQDSQLLQQAKEAGFKTFAVKMHKGLNFGAIWTIAKIIKEQHVDIVHSHSSVDHRLAGLAAKLLGCPLVRSRHLSTPIKRSPLSKFLYTRLADRVITSGEFIRQAMIVWNRMPEDLIVSIPAGIDEKKFSLERALPDVREEQGWGKEAFVVGIVAVLRSWKGHEDLIAAVDIARRSIPNLKLLVVGEGVRRHAIEKMIEEAGLGDIVRLAGYQKDPAPYIKAMDVVVLPSYANEATSQVLPQAMAMMRPVISTNIGGLPEVVEHESTGLLVPPRSPFAIAEAIQRLYQDPELRSKLARIGYERVIERFTFTRMIDDTAAVYNAVI
jgi:glycosyltransferase involved in cell wall biosynthesis